MEEKKKIKIKRHYIVGFFLFLLVVIPIGLYFYSPLARFTQGIFRYFPYPVAIVDGSLITTRELIADTEAVQNFYKSQDFSSIGMRLDFNTDEGANRLKVKEKDVLDKLVENKIVKKLAKEKDIKVTAQDAQKSIEREIENSGGNSKNLTLNLQKTYGWSINEFRDKVVIPQLYVSKLIEYYYKNEQPNQAGFKKISQARKELKADGSNFSDVVTKFSEGESAKNGGEVGWFRREQMAAEVANAAFSLEMNKISEIIQSPLGYHIIVVEESREIDDENSGSDPKTKEVRLKQIFVKDGGFLSWITDQKKNAGVLILMRDYMWDKGVGLVKFRDENMRKMEEDIKLKSSGDPSMM